jgi:cobyrinic acid a,c-diamide synthase
MGLFDGASEAGPSSTADIAELLRAPVLLVVDAGAMSESVAAVVHGYATFDRRVALAGVILNQVGSAGHEILLREALSATGVPVLGALPLDDRLRWRDRHLGLVPVAEEPANVAGSLDLLAEAIVAHVDLDSVLALARTAPEMIVGDVEVPARGPHLRVAVAGGKAFTFTYTDTIDALEAAGCEIVAFDPLVDESVPAGMDGIIIGGGFPEVYASELSSNVGLLTQLRRAVEAGVPVWAECGGLLLLSQDLDGAALAGVVPAHARMSDRLTLGYRRAVARSGCPIGPRGTEITGHEFHYSVLEPAGDALDLSSRWGSGTEGWSSPTLLATYLHHHPGGDPGAVESFARTCALRRGLRSG